MVSIRGAGAVLAAGCLCGAVVMASRVLRDEASVVVIGWSCLAALLVYWFLWRFLETGHLVAGVGGMAYVCHPLIVPMTVTADGTIVGLTVAAVPLAGLLAFRLNRVRPVVGSIVTGVAAGVVAAWSLPIGMVLFGMVMVATSASIGHSPTARLHPDSTRSPAVVFGACAPAFMTALGLIRWVAPAEGWTAPFATTLGSSMCHTALAWVDGHGLMGPLRAALPAELRPEGDGEYLGWSLIILCLFGLTAGGFSRPARRRSTLLLLVGLIALWLLQGPSSAHEQLRATFEYMLVKRQTSHTAQQLLGLSAALLALAAGLLWGSVARVFSRGDRLSLAGVLIASGALLVWWCSNPRSWLSRQFDGTILVDLQPTLRTLVAFGLVCGAAVGIVELARRSTTPARGWLTRIVLSSLLLADVCGHAGLIRDQKKKRRVLWPPRRPPNR